MVFYACASQYSRLPKIYQKNKKKKNKTTANKSQSPNKQTVNQTKANENCDKQ